MTLPQVVLVTTFGIAAPVLCVTIGPRWVAALAAGLAAALLPLGALGSLVLTAGALAAPVYAYRRSTPSADPPAPIAPDGPGTRPPQASPGPRRPPPTYTLAIGPLRQRIEIPLGVAEGHHALCVGASGWGKTWAMLTIVQAHLRAGFGCVVVDMKGSFELVERLRLEAVLAGRPFWHFALDGGNRWNPLGRGNRSELKDKLISSQHFSEEHYKRLYEHYLLRVFELVEARAGGGPIDLAGLTPLLDPRRLEGELRTVDDPPMVEELNRYLATMTDDKRRALAGLADRLAVITEGIQGEYLSAAGDPAELIDLLRVVACRGVVVFSLSASRYPETAQLMGNLVLQDLNAVSGVLEAIPRSTPPMLIAVDEFSGLGGAHVLNLFQRSRSPRWSLLLLTQEVADLRRIRPTFHEEINANVELIVAGRQNNPESAEWLSKVAGTREVWRRSFALDRRGRPTGRGTMDAVREPLIPPDTIMRLTTGNALVVRKRPHHDACIAAIIPAGATEERWPEGMTREWVLARAAHLRWRASQSSPGVSRAAMGDSPRDGVLSPSPPRAAGPPPLR